MPNTEADEGRHEEMRAYPEPPEMSRADLVAEGEWWDWWWAEGRHREANGPLIDALDRAVADRDPGTDWGEAATQRVLARLREDGAL